MATKLSMLFRKTVVLTARSRSLPAAFSTARRFFSTWCVCSAMPPAPTARRVGLRRGGAPRPEVAGLGIERDLPRTEHQAVGDDGLRIGAERLGGGVGL